jgi:TetR/AcrR family transcriptional regulator, tetracycline repressor protein
VGISREQVVETAVRLLDEVGLEGLTLRRLAAELDVQAPALYWHVRNKRELLDLMAEAIVATTRPKALGRPAHGQPWWEWLAERSRAGRRALLAHRDGALVAAGNRPTAAALPEVEQVLAELVAVGFPPAEALHTVLSLGAYVGGSALEEQAEANRSEEDRERDQQLLAQMLDSDRYPTLAAAAAGALSGGEDTFEHGLRLLTDGLRARHAELHGLPFPGRDAVTTPDAAR